jgi:hypothetical protein
VTGCQTNPSNAKASANQTATPNSNKLENIKPEATGYPKSSLATPADAYKTAFNLRQKKNIQELKLVMSKRMLEFFEAIGVDEKKTVDDQLKELVEQPQAKTAEVRNEKITGDTATIEYLDENGKWKEMDFVKEGNDWKLTIANGRPQIENTTRK